MRTFFCLLLCLPVFGCGGSPYKPEGFGGGYTDMQLDRNIYRVSFRGNGGTSEQRAEDFALLRSAELTLEQGYTHFIILDSASRISSSVHSIPETSTTRVQGTVSGNTFRGTGTTTTTGGGSYVITKPRSTNTIICFKERPDVQGLVYDATHVRNTIRAKYGL